MHLHRLRKTPLEQYFKGHDKLLYIYDFGDYWTHEITLEDGNYDGGGTALCLAGKGACPPEDIGGYGGYECMKQAFATHPYGKEANSYREWLGMGKRKTWDAKAFSIEESNDLLRYVQTLSPIFTKDGGNEDIGIVLVNNDYRISSYHISESQRHRIHKRYMM